MEDGEKEATIADLANAEEYMSQVHGQLHADLTKTRQEVDGMTAARKIILNRLYRLTGDDFYQKKMGGE